MQILVEIIAQQTIPADFMYNIYILTTNLVMCFKVNITSVTGVMAIQVSTF